MEQTVADVMQFVKDKTKTKRGKGRGRGKQKAAVAGVEKKASTPAPTSALP